MHVVLHRLFAKSFQKLPHAVQLKFVERRNIFLVDPFSRILNNHSVDKRFPGCRSINVTGDYRAIFTITDTHVLFLYIGTHSELYE